MMTPIDPSFETLIVSGAEIDTIAGGFEFTEGPVWNSENQTLVFSDIHGDAMYAWSKEGCDVFRRPSGQDFRVSPPHERNRGAGIGIK